MGSCHSMTSVVDKKSEKRDYLWPVTPHNSPELCAIKATDPIHILSLEEAEEVVVESKSERKRSEQRLSITIDPVSPSARVAECWSPFRFRVWVDAKSSPTSEQEAQFEHAMKEAELPTEEDSPVLADAQFLRPPLSPLPVVGITLHTCPHFVLSVRRSSCSEDHCRLDRQVKCAMTLSWKFIAEVLLLYVGLLNQMRYLLRDLGCMQLELKGDVCDVQHGLNGKEMLDHLATVAIAIQSRDHSTSFSALRDISIQLDASPCSHRHDIRRVTCPLSDTIEIGIVHANHIPSYFSRHFFHSLKTV